MTTQLSSHPVAIQSRRQRERERAGLVKRQPPTPCQFCRAPDARDAAHARGCPSLAPGSFAGLHALALAVEAGWAEMRQQRALAAAAPRTFSATG